jgi:glycosyltransferase involved in cell wall biosynthesis
MTDLVPGPTVSVILPVYNGEGYIASAIRSILDQTLQNIELIVISEFGTSPASIAEVEGFHDPRVVHVQNRERLGLISSLNLGLGMAKGRYIARMDSDDVSLPDRLSRQVAYMDAHPKVGVLGTMVTYIDASGKRTYRPRYFWRPETVAWDLLFNSPIPHPSALLRPETVRRLGGYDPNAKLVEDYDLWIRASHVTTITNLPDELVLIRKHGENITVTRREEQRRAASRLAGREMERLLGRTVDQDEVFRLRYPDSIVDRAGSLGAADLLNEIYGRFISSRSLPPAALREVRKDLVRMYSVLVARGRQEHWKATSALLERAREGAGVSRTAILAQALVRRALSD